MTAERRRNFFVLLLVFGLIAASVAAILTRETKLGLDLQGGVSLVYEGKPTPQQPTITQEALDRALDIVRERVDSLGVAEPEIQRSGRTQIEVNLPAVQNADRAAEQVGTTAQLSFYDWEPNVVTGPNCEQDPTDRGATETPLPNLYEAVKRAAQCPAERDEDNAEGSAWYLFAKGGGAPLAGPTETREDLVEEYRAETGKSITTEEVYEVKPGTIVLQNERPETLPENVEVSQYYVIRDNVALGGTDIRNPEQNFDQRAGNQPIVTMEFTREGREKFQRVTREIAQRGQENAFPGQDPDAANQHFAVVLDGKIVSRPVIDFTENPDGIDGSTGAQISGGFTIQGAQDLAKFLKIGALPIELELISRSQVSATLGQQALDEGLAAALAGFAIVALFLVTFYRVLGLIATTALGVYGIYLYALVKLIPVVLTLPGIAGLILTIGVAADANIVVFERVKEEIRAGRSVSAGIAQGYKKGFATIIDANVVTLLVAFILFILATAGVKGFALLLGLGTLVSLFTAVLATQAILLSLRGTRVIKSRSALGAGEQRVRWTLDFMGASKWFFSASGVILLAGALAIAGLGLNFGIDFEAGSRITAALDRPASAAEVREVLAEVGVDDAKIQTVSGSDLGENVVQISTATLQPEQVTDVREALAGPFGVTQQDFSTESIGPTFGQSVATSALYAVIASLLVISAYIALRFEAKFAVPVIIALLHDLLITAGIYSLTGREVTTSTVAALLTILGFSLYDTIIVFDRIRENIPRMPRAAFSQIVNRSMSEVLTRSLATSFCTGLPVLGLLLFGGETLQDFAFALLIGTLSGTYSSVFIAGPVLTLWKEREPLYRRRRARIAAEHGGVVPAFPTTVGGAPADVEPEAPKTRRSGLTPAGQPGEVSREEFEAMVAQLPKDELEPRGPRGGRRARMTAGGAAGTAPPPPSPRPAAPDGPSAPSPATPPGDPKDKPNPASRKDRRKHGRPR